LLSSACAPLSASRPLFSEATTLCSLVQDEQRYAGQAVTVRALLHHSPHGRTVNDPDCRASMDFRGSSEHWERRARRVVNGALVGDPRALIPVVIRGVFQPSVRYEGGQRVVTGGPSIEQGRVVAARLP
jgi:hypothetical protein